MSDRPTWCPAAQLEGNAAMISVHRITPDCANVAAVARFWSETLGGRIDPGTPSDVAVLEARADTGPLRLAFRKVPGGKFFKNRVHLDLVTDHFDLEGARLRDLIDANVRGRQ
jgi:Glyoxalase-like domain